jgi:ATP-dependent helicase/nuclease subunit B
MRQAHSRLLALAAEGYQIVTPDSLHASMVAERYVAARLHAGRGEAQGKSWERPSIQSIDAWLSTCWQEVRYNLADVPVLLSTAQELVLWREVIAAEGDELLNAEATADLARRAALTVLEWGIPLDAPEWGENEDGLRFRAWYQDFRRLCTRRGFATRGDLWTFVPQWIASGDCCTGKMAFFGFAAPSPGLKKLLGALRDRALVIPVKASPVAASVSACDDFEQEMEYAARWARAMFENRPDVSLGVFIPDLSAHRSSVERTFRRVFYPGSALRFENKKDSGASAFHIAAAAPLEKDPLIAGALLLLELGASQMSLADASSMLRCPFLSGATSERSERAKADLQLRRGRELEVSLRQLQYAAKDCPSFLRILHVVNRLKEEHGAYEDLPTWSEFIGELLQATGWPGENVLTADEEEVVERWNKALSALATLGMVAGAVPYRSALTQLRRLLTGPGIEVGDWSSPVQVLDTRTAEALSFDAVFAVGLSEEAWPRGRPVSSLIPLQLQRAYQVPCASQQSVQEEQRRMAAALFASGEEIAGSYSGRLSPFAEPYISAALQMVWQWSGKLPRESFQPVALEELIDSNAPPFQLTGEVRGGTGIIKSQSLCPFRAFAEYRLDARFPDDARFGLDPLQRGSFLHKTLELVWQSIETQERLVSLGPEPLRAVVNEAVGKAIASQRGSEFQQQTAEVERERVAELVYDWLTEVELARTQPFQVEKIEGERIFEIGGVKIRLRIDRIDRLQNGRLMLIDYKSGKQTANSLTGKRPSEPQLWIYATAVGEEVGGIFFGQLKPRDFKMVGFSQEREFTSTKTGVLKGKWDGFLQECRENVERLAQEFAAGRAAVNPKKGACEFCGIAPLCRTYERVSPGAELTDSEND